MILLIGGEKGGCGKSTLSVNLGSEFAKRNFSVSILDADKKKSSKNWVVSRDILIRNIETGETSQGIDSNSLAKKVRDKIRKSLPKVEGKHSTGDIIDIILAMQERSDILILDVGGGDTEEFHQGLGMADYIICPLKASIFDADTAPKLNQNLKLAKSKNRNLIIKTVVNEAPTTIGSTDAHDLKSILSGYEMLNNISRIVVHSRAAYRKCINYGLGVTEWSDSKAAGEISCLAEEIINEMNLKARIKEIA